MFYSKPNLKVIFQNRNRGSLHQKLTKFLDYYPKVFYYMPYFKGSKIGIRTAQLNAKYNQLLISNKYSFEYIKGELRLLTQEFYEKFNPNKPDDYEVLGSIIYWFISALSKGFMYYKKHSGWSGYSMGVTGSLAFLMFYVSCLLEGVDFMYYFGKSKLEVTRLVVKSIINGRPNDIDLVTFEEYSIPHSILKERIIPGMKFPFSEYTFREIMTTSNKVMVILCGEFKFVLSDNTRSINYYNRKITL